MFAQFPIYTAGLTSEDHLLNTDHIEEVLPHANVPVDPGTVDTECCEVRFYSTATAITLLPYSEVFSRLQAMLGLIDTTGEVS